MRNEDRMTDGPARRAGRIGVWMALLLLFLGPAGDAAAQEGLPCLRCHKSKTAGAHLHPAVEMGCASCHAEPHAEEEPELSLSADVPDLCYGCHGSDAFQGASVHPPVEIGMCYNCHDPHSTDTPKLLTAEPPALCFVCHEEEAFRKETVHPPVAAGDCGTCHAPHASAHTAHLRRPIVETCAMCHPDRLSGRHVFAAWGLGGSHPVRGMLDPSAADGRELACTSCHDPHSSTRKALLIDDGPEDERLCWRCHRKITTLPAEPFRR